MKVIIIGNGLAGVTVASNLVSLDPSVEVEIFSEENYPYYSRVKLVDFMMGTISKEDLIVFEEFWYEARDITLHLQSRVIEVIPKKKKIIVEDVTDPKKTEEHDFDKLVIASGSKPIIPKSALEQSSTKKTILEPVHRDKKGWHVLRTIDDAIEIREHLKQAQRVNILGSGLLGLEIADKFRTGNNTLDTTIIEIEPIVAPAYLDKKGSFVLSNLLERAGVKILIDTRVTECTGEEYIEGCRLSDKTIQKGDIILFACGIKPNVDFLVDSGIEMIETPDYEIEADEVIGQEFTRSILVNEHMQTNFDDIYAVGDCCEFDGFMYGINPAAIEQAKHCAYNIIQPGGETMDYKGTIPIVTFHGFDTELASIGRVNEYTIGQAEMDDIFSYFKVDLTLGEYKKIFIKDEKLIGAILIGNISLQMEIRRMILEKINVSEFADKILEENFNLRDFI